MYFPVLAPKYIHFRYGPNVYLPKCGTEPILFSIQNFFRDPGVQSGSVTKITPKEPFLCMNTGLRYGFRVDPRAIP